MLFLRPNTDGLESHDRKRPVDACGWTNGRIEAGVLSSSCHVRCLSQPAGRGINKLACQCKLVCWFTMFDSLFTTLTWLDLWHDRRWDTFPFVWSVLLMHVSVIPFHLRYIRYFNKTSSFVPIQNPFVLYYRLDLGAVSVPQQIIKWGICENNSNNVKKMK